MKLTIISDKGSPMMVVTKVNRKGDCLEITGQLMGAWPSKMYITPEQFGGFIKMAFSPSVMAYLFLYPFYYLTRRNKPKKDGID